MKQQTAETEIAAIRFEKLQELNKLQSGKNFSEQYTNIINLYLDNLRAHRAVQTLEEIDVNYRVAKILLSASNEERGMIKALSALGPAKEVFYDIMWINDLSPAFILWSNQKCHDLYEGYVKNSEIRLGFRKPDQPNIPDSEQPMM